MTWTTTTPVPQETCRCGAVLVLPEDNPDLAAKAFRRDHQTCREQPVWQRCPVCGGKGIVPQGFYDTPMAAGFATNTAPDQCRACGGKGMVQ